MGVGEGRWKGGGVNVERGGVGWGGGTSGGGGRGERALDALSF